ncbi:MAG: EAL domain-containing response regulator [Thalassobaculaceae bacterium]|nr:EAL domain-containing response regulator [Thalassobaculaceae bacterium]
MAEGPPGTLRVMVVDDEPTQRLAVTLMCRTMGLPEAATFESGHAALEALAGSSRGTDLVLCDLDMPEMDGMEFIRRAADLDQPPALMILSGHESGLLNSVERMGKAYGLRMMGSVRKPLTRDTLEATLAVLTKAGPAVPVMMAPADTEMVDALIDSGRFIPFFQPQLTLAGLAVHGAEALARLVQPDGTVDMPAVFLRRISERGMMTDFTVQILDRTLEAMSAWPKAMPPLNVSINLTPMLFDDLAIMGDLMARIDRAGVPRDRLVFEVVETAVSRDQMRFTESAARLRLRGFGLAIDDYGQGHATLDQLRRLPFSELKIDRAFVIGLDGDADNRAIVANTIAMAKAMDLRVVAEGVETEAEADTLRALGCDLAQGFLYSRAVPSADFVSFVLDRLAARV